MNWVAFWTVWAVCAASLTIVSVLANPFFENRKLYKWHVLGCVATALFTSIAGLLS